MCNNKSTFQLLYKSQLACSDAPTPHSCARTEAHVWIARKLWAALESIHISDSRAPVLHHIMAPTVKTVMLLLKNL